MIYRRYGVFPLEMTWLFFLRELNIYIISLLNGWYALLAVCVVGVYACVCVFAFFYILLTPTNTKFSFKQPEINFKLWVNNFCNKRLYVKSNLNYQKWI